MFMKKKSAKIKIWSVSKNECIGRTKETDIKPHFPLQQKHHLPLLFTLCSLTLAEGKQRRVVTLCSTQGYIFRSVPQFCPYKIWP